jgi:hypothetical protein
LMTAKQMGALKKVRQRLEIMLWIRNKTMNGTLSITGRNSFA